MEDDAGDAVIGCEAEQVSPGTPAVRDEEINISPRDSPITALEEDGSGHSVRATKIFAYDNPFTILPASIGRFRELQVLNVFNNEVKYLPDEVGELPKLEKLRISSQATGLSNVWPPGKMSELKSLELHRVKHPSASAIPSDVAKLQGLRRISISQFSVSFLPPEIGALKLLEELDFSYNKLKFLPKELARLSSLKVLNVSNNKLVELPPEVTTMVALTSINAGNNKLTSLLNLDLEAMTSLRELNVEANKFDGIEDIGDIPDWLKCNHDFDLGLRLISPQRPKKYVRRQAVQPLQTITKVEITSRKHKLEELVFISEKVIKDNASQHSAKSTMSKSVNMLEDEPEVEAEVKAGPKIEVLGESDGQPEDPEEKPAENKISAPVTPVAPVATAEPEEQPARGSQGTPEPIQRKKARDSEADEDNPKPSKRKKSVGTSSDVSYKYNKESFCGVRDRLPDGFYDAGRESPFTPLDTLESKEVYVGREVLLVDRTVDEELDVIASTANRLLLRHGIQPTISYVFLALFVSDCFGGSDKTPNVKNMRRSTLGSTSGVPFICSCSAGGSQDGSGVPSMYELCHEALKHLKNKRRSNVVPLGSLPYGICRHRAILFKYLCDRAVPVIPCELIRGFFDYEHHAWNIVLVPSNGTNVRMLVDCCRPLDIRLESDEEFFCRYVPFKRIHVQGPAEIDLGSETLAPLFYEEIGSGSSGAMVYRCSIGGHDAAAKVRHVTMDGNGWLSELRMHSSLGSHPCIVGFYGHQLSFDSLVLSNQLKCPQLAIFMEYVKGGSLENFIKKLKEDGHIYMPPSLALRIARSVASGLAWLHSRGIIHRDIKSSNIVVDLESSDSPIVKICDFDSAVPVNSSSAHTCYLRFQGHPLTDICVGTPLWLAPEVLEAYFFKRSYGVEADMWSFGCLVVELLTLQVPYVGIDINDVESCVRGGTRPAITWKLEELTFESDQDREVVDTLLNVYESCTEYDPAQRPSAARVLNRLQESNELDV